MFIRQFTTGLILGLIALLAACAPPPPPTATPIPTETLTPTPDASPTPLARPTLPPTWTPTFTPTEPFVPATATEDPRVQQVLDNPSPPGVCDSFRPDISRNPSSIVIGSAVQVYWNAPLDATQYEVALFDDRGFRIDVRRTDETTARFDADLFEPNRQYGWAVIPFGEGFDPLCLPQGGEFRVEFPTITPAADEG